MIEDGARKMVSSMEWLETVYVDGVMLEAFTTSGGLGTLSLPLSAAPRDIPFDGFLATSTGRLFAG